MSAYLERAERIIREAGARLERRKGECRDCRWSKAQFAGRDHCNNPVVILASETIDQRRREYLVQCDQQRGKESTWGPVVCGPDGDLFERRAGFLETIFGPRKDADHD